MTGFDHSAGIQFAPASDHAHASMHDDNIYAQESQEVYVDNGGQTYIQNLEYNGDVHVAEDERNRSAAAGSNSSSKYVFLPLWLKNSPTYVKVGSAGVTLLVVIFIAIMASGIAKLPSNYETTNLSTSAEAGSNNNPSHLPTREPSAAQVPATSPPSSSEVGITIIVTPPPTTEPTTPAIISNPNPTEQPTRFPALTCPKNLDNVVNIDQSTVLRYGIVLLDSGENGIMCGKLEVQNQEGWVGLAISLDGQMVGSDAIIGEPSTQSVLKYNLNGKAANLVDPMSTAKQTLTDTSIVQDKGGTTMTFTKILVEPDEIPITPQGDNIFLHARGVDTTIGYHSAKVTFNLNFASPVAPNLPTTQPTTQPITSPMLGDSSVACSESAPCEQCLGSCNSDANCAGELQCFLRGYLERIPGCSGQGKYGQSYCYNPFADGETTLLTTATKACDKKAPCGKCFGTCDADEDCDKNLFCYRRYNNPLELVPGCAGQGVFGAHYCFDPTDISGS